MVRGAALSRLGLLPAPVQKQKCPELLALAAGALQLEVRQTQPFSFSCLPNADGLSG